MMSMPTPQPIREHGRFDRLSLVMNFLGAFPQYNTSEVFTIQEPRHEPQTEAAEMVE
jgi:hypothetical protein